MPALRYYNKDTGDWWLFGAVDGVDTTGMGNATAVPPANAVPVAANFEVQYGDKAIPLSDSVWRIPGTGGSGTTGVAPGAPASVTATVESNGSVTNRVTAPTQIGTPPYSGIVTGLDGATDPNPVVTPTGEANFAGLPPGVYIPWAYAFGAGVGPTVYGSPVTIAGSGTPPVISGVPAILGSLKYGATLTVTLPSATGAVSSSIQWLRNGAPIAGATSNTYTLTTADVGAKISVRVTFTAADSSVASATSTQSAAVGKADLSSTRPVPMITGTGEVGTLHTIDWGLDPNAFTPIPIGGAATKSILIDGVLAVSGTHGIQSDYDSWYPQAEDIGLAVIARHAFYNSSNYNDKNFESPSLVIRSSTSGLTSVVVANDSPAQGLMATLSSINGASLSGTSATISARTDAGTTGGIGVYEMNQAGLTAWQAGDFATAASNQVLASDIGAYAPGTVIPLGPFSSGTVALVFKPIGSGTYSYTLALGSGTTPTADDTGVFFDDGMGLYFDSSDGLYFER